MASPHPGTQFRELISQGTIMIPGVFNALVARMAQRAGFKAVYQSGAALSAGLAALPDIGLISQTEFAAQGKYLAEAVSIPVISDADTGFGEAISVERTVTEYESAGLAGLHLEDQQLPKRCGHLSGKSLITKEEMVGKIQAAVSARRSDQFVIIARTDAKAVYGMEEAIDRAKACVDAGADMIFPEALQTREEFEQFSKAISVPLMANMTEFGKSPLFTAEELEQMGYAAVLFPVTLFRIGMKAVEDALEEIQESKTQKGLLEKMQSRSRLYDFLDYEGFDKRDQDYFQLGE